MGQCYLLCFLLHPSIFETGSHYTTLAVLELDIYRPGWHRTHRDPVCVSLILLLVCLYTWGCRCPQRPKEATCLCPFLGVHRFYRHTFQMAVENLNVKLALEFSPTF